jgi:hypothetical protein
MAKSPCQLVISTFLFVFHVNNIFHLCIIFFQVSKYHYEVFIYKTFSKVLLCFHVQQKLLIVFFIFVFLFLDSLFLDLVFNGVYIYVFFATLSRFLNLVSLNIHHLCLINLLMFNIDNIICFQSIIVSSTNHSTKLHHSF